MQLIGSLTSPFVRKIRILLAEKGLDYQMVIDIPWNADTQVPEKNPLGKVPVLVLDDGFSLFDSAVITDYIDTLAGPSFIPHDSWQRILVKRHEALADGITEATVAIFLERRRPESQQSPEWIARQYQKVAAGLAALAQELGDKDFFCGAVYSLADMATIACLGYLDLRLSDVVWREQYPVLARFMAQFAERDSVKDTIPPV